MKHVALAIITHEQKILLGKRSPSCRACPGLWDIIGGHVERGESICDALKREVLEELGVTIREFAELATIEEARPHLGGPAIFHLWLVTRWEGTLDMLGTEHVELRWFTVEEACGLGNLAHEGYIPFFGRCAA